MSSRSPSTRSSLTQRAQLDSRRGRAADQQPHRARRRVPLAHLAADRAELRAGIARPSPRARRTTPRRARPPAPDGEAEVAPAFRSRRREIGVLDVEAAEHRHRAVGDDDLLVVANQVAPGQPRNETAERAAGLDQRREERLAGHRAEAVDDHAHIDPAARRGDQRVAHPHPAVVVGEDVERELEASRAPSISAEQRRRAVRGPPG